MNSLKGLLQKRVRSYIIALESYQKGFITREEMNEIQREIKELQRFVR